MSYLKVFLFTFRFVSKFNIAEHIHSICFYFVSMNLILNKICNFIVKKCYILKQWETWGNNMKHFWGEFRRYGSQ